MQIHENTIHNHFDLNLFKIFAAIYTYGTVTKAAQQLNLTQPAVSRSLSKLNDLYGQKLFIRQHNQMIPTRFADHIADHIFQTLLYSQQALLIGRTEHRFELPLDFKIGLNDYCATLLYPKLYESAVNINKDIKLSSIHCDYTNVVDKFETMQTDCAIISEPLANTRYLSYPLFQDDYVVIAHADCPISNATYPLEQFIKQKHILVSYVGDNQGWVDDKLKILGMTRHVMFTVHFFSVVPLLLVSNDIVSTIPRRLANHFKAYHPIKIYELPFESKVHEFILVIPKYSAFNPYTQSMVKMIQEIRFLEPVHD